MMPEAPARPRRTACRAAVAFHSSLHPGLSMHRTRRWRSRAACAAHLAPLGQERLHVLLGLLLGAARCACVRKRQRRRQRRRDGGSARRARARLAARTARTRTASAVGCSTTPLYLPVRSHWSTSTSTLASAKLALAARAGALACPTAAPCCRGPCRARTARATSSPGPRGASQSRRACRAPSVAAGRFGGSPKRSTHTAMPVYIR